MNEQPKRVVQLQLGSPVWRFDTNRRRYTAPANGRAYGDIIWREQWAPLVVIGETPRSWIIGRSNSKSEVAKLPKADCRKGPPRGWAFSQDHIDEDDWIHTHRHQLVALLQRSSDYAMLREVARVAGYGDKGAP